MLDVTVDGVKRPAYLGPTTNRGRRASPTQQRVEKPTKRRYSVKYKAPLPSQGMSSTTPSPNKSFREVSLLNATEPGSNGRSPESHGNSNRLHQHMGRGGNGTSGGISSAASVDSFVSSVGTGSRGRSLSASRASRSGRATTATGTRGATGGRSRSTSPNSYIGFGGSVRSGRSGYSGDARSVTPTLILRAAIGGTSGSGGALGTALENVSPDSQTQGFARGSVSGQQRSVVSSPSTLTHSMASASHSMLYRNFARGGPMPQHGLHNIQLSQAAFRTIRKAQMRGTIEDFLEGNDIDYLGLEDDNPEELAAALELQDDLGQSGGAGAGGAGFGGTLSAVEELHSARTPEELRRKQVRLIMQARQAENGILPAPVGGPGGLKTGGTVGGRTVHTLNTVTAKSPEELEMLRRQRRLAKMLKNIQSSLLEQQDALQGGAETAPLEVFFPCEHPYSEPVMSARFAIIDTISDWTQQFDEVLSALESYEHFLSKSRRRHLELARAAQLAADQLEVATEDNQHLKEQLRELVETAEDELKLNVRPLLNDFPSYWYSQPSMSTFAPTAASVTSCSPSTIMRRQQQQQQAALRKRQAAERQRAAGLSQSLPASPARYPQQQQNISRFSGEYAPGAPPGSYSYGDIGAGAAQGNDHYTRNQLVTTQQQQQQQRRPRDVSPLAGAALGGGSPPHGGGAMGGGRPCGDSFGNTGSAATLAATTLAALAASGTAPQQPAPPVTTTGANNEAPRSADRGRAIERLGLARGVVDVEEHFSLNYDVIAQLTAAVGASSNAAPATAGVAAGAGASSNAAPATAGVAAGAGASSNAAPATAGVAAGAEAAVQPPPVPPEHSKASASGSAPVATPTAKAAAPAAATTSMSKLIDSSLPADSNPHVEAFINPTSPDADDTAKEGSVDEASDPIASAMESQEVREPVTLPTVLASDSNAASSSGGGRRGGGGGGDGGSSTSASSSSCPTSGAGAVSAGKSRRTSPPRRAAPPAEPPLTHGSPEDLRAQATTLRVLKQQLQQQDLEGAKESGGENVSGGVGSLFGRVKEKGGEGGEEEKEEAVAVATDGSSRGGTVDTTPAASSATSHDGGSGDVKGNDAAPKPASTDSEKPLAVPGKLSGSRYNKWREKKRSNATKT